MSRMPIASLWLLASLALSACSSEPAPPADAPALNQPPVPDAKQADKPAANPTPEDVLQQVADFYSQVKTVEVRIEKAIDMEFNGRSNSAAAQSMVMAERPNRLSLVNSDKNSEVRLVSDGETLTTYIPGMGKYVEAAAPAAFDSLSSDQQFLMLAGGMVPVPLLLLSTDSQATLLEGVASLSYVGKEQLQGRSVHHLRGPQTSQSGGIGIEWDLWVSAEGDPLVRQLRRTTLPGQRIQMKTVVTETFHDWKFNEPIADETFVFTPPEGAEQVDDLFAAAGNRPGGPPKKPEPVPSSGNPVIDFFRAVDRGVKSTTPGETKPKTEPSDSGNGENPPEEE
jgi:hypothetical protein